MMVTLCPGQVSMRKPVTDMQCTSLQADCHLLRTGKFGCYKRPGQRVFLDQAGQLKVRPNPLELQLQVCVCSRPNHPAAAGISHSTGSLPHLHCQRQSQQLTCLRLQASRKISVHMLNAYRVALLAALRLQFTRRGLPGGRAGVLALLGSNPVLRELLAAEGCVAVHAVLDCGQACFSCILSCEACATGLLRPDNQSPCRIDYEALSMQASASSSSSSSDGSPAKLGTAAAMQQQQQRPQPTQPG